MSIIQRPTKQGGATTYQGKVAAGYTKILASEMDADLDLIYSVWNQGVDTVNIADGSITGAKLVPGAVGTRELADGGVQTVDIGDGQVTTPKLADLNVTTGKLADGAVTSAKIADGAITAADIANGTINDAKIANLAWTKLVAPLLGTLPLTPRASFFAGSSLVDIEANVPGSDQYDGGKPSWMIRLDYGNDLFLVYRAPAPGTTFVEVLRVSGAGVTTCTLANGSVGRNQLAANACNGAPVTVAVPPSFILSTTGWATLATLPAFTTRGGFVHLWAAAGLSVFGPGASGGNCWTRWLCDGVPLGVQDVHPVSTSSPIFVPVPNFNWMHNPVAGSHTYAYQVAVDTGMTIVTSNAGGGLLLAVEVG